MIEFIKGENIYMRPLLESDLNNRYLEWLNNPVTNSFSRRKRFPYTFTEMVEFYENSTNSGITVLAIVEKQNNKHIGNITLNEISWVDRSANVDILIGERSTWNKGFGKEAISLIEEHAFLILNMHHLTSRSVNPYFIKIVQKLNWVNDGIFKDSIFLDGTYLDLYHFTKYNVKYI